MIIILLQYLKFDDGAQGNPRRRAAVDADRQIVAVAFFVGREILQGIVVGRGIVGIKNDFIRF